MKVINYPSFLWWAFSWPRETTDHRSEWCRAMWQQRRSWDSLTLNWQITQQYRRYIHWLLRSGN